MSIEKDPAVAIDTLIKKFLDTHRFLRPCRIQKLIYLAELMYVEKHEKRLTNAQYEPYMYGVYSETIDYTISDLIKEDQSISSKNTYRSRRIARKSSSNIKLDNELKELVKVVTDLTRHMNNYQLADWSKSTYLFNETRYDSVINLNSYVDAINNNQIRPDWKILLNRDR